MQEEGIAILEKNALLYRIYVSLQQIVIGLPTFLYVIN